MASVLIVDSHASVLAKTIAAFAQAGYAAMGASTFQAAKRLLHNHPPDVLIADLRLGAFNGLHLAVLGRRNNPTMTTIVTHSPADRPDGTPNADRGAPWRVKVQRGTAWSQQKRDRQSLEERT